MYFFPILNHLILLSGKQPILSGTLKIKINIIFCSFCLSVIQLSETSSARYLILSDGYVPLNAEF